jgi:CO/xanthine dehydrogenase FAD-binding subunit
MIAFEVLVPGTLEECLSLLAEHGEDACVLSGGTDLYILMKAQIATPRLVIPIKHLHDLREISLEDGGISLGAGLTHAEIAELGILNNVPCLTEAARSVGSPQIRNAGSAGGNLANASPAADLYPPLLALDARLEILRREGKRTVSLDEFTEGPGVTALSPDEIIGSVRFPVPTEPRFSAHRKVGLRNALAVSVTSAAIVAGAEGGLFRDVRVACGAVAPTPIRMKMVERLLSGEAPTEELIEEAGRVAASECDPVTDIRATREYRCRVTGVIVSRLVRQAACELLGYQDA